MKAVLIFLVFLVHTHSAFSSTMKIQVEYSESADTFELLDNSSNWWPDFVDPEYHSFWQRNFGLTKSEKNLFEKYKKIRKKYYNDPDQDEKNPLKNRNGFFSTLGSITADPFAEAFYSSNTLKESYQKLSKILSAEELKFVEGFFENFRSKIESTIAKNKTGFEKSIELTKKSTSKDGVEAYFTKVSNFYNVKTDLNYRVLFVWMPPVKRSHATPTGQYLVIRSNPDVHKETDFSEIVAHEIVHVISSFQSLEQKKILTEKFLSLCPLGAKISPKLKKYVILEEPLAVNLGQLFYSEKFQDKKMELSDNLYNNPWINTFARIIYSPLKKRFEKGERLDQGFVDDAGKLCNDLYQAAGFLK